MKVINLQESLVGIIILEVALSNVKYVDGKGGLKQKISHEMVGIPNLFDNCPDMFTTLDFMAD